mmetsp:Transcript_41254/g.58033  ORF Transcript_41254/g.58033 Transcript_41254/m.58033 type:complete len:92 (+) Transcript_41254:1556-1831(+)
MCLCLWFDIRYHRFVAGILFRSSSERGTPHGRFGRQDHGGGLHSKLLALVYGLGATPCEHQGDLCLLCAVPSQFKSGLSPNLFKVDKNIRS